MELEKKTWTVAFFAQFEVPPQHFPGGIVENHEEISGQAVSGPRYEPETLPPRI
jgi:hypothetical protein